MSSHFQTVWQRPVLREERAVHLAAKQGMLRYTDSCFIALSGRGCRFVQGLLPFTPGRTPALLPSLVPVRQRVSAAFPLGQSLPTA